ncbi:MAG: hypothetical protein IJ184_04560 [Alphaproteobacteria bacterium]|nr:hypothetical protein [Alphaproteobacteria bacterium]
MEDSEANNDINYDRLMEKALKHVVIEALKIAADEGLSDTNHFYITFKTDHPDVRMDTALLDRWPETMTIVLQHQFANLMISDDYFEVDLSFNDVPHTLRIPWDAITYFADPYARFGLSFAFEETTPPSSDETTAPVKEAAASRSAASCAKPSGTKADVVSIDAFRKK